MEKTILLADDSHDDVEIFKHTLQKAGVVNPLRVVHDGSETIKYLSGEGIYADRELHPFPSVLMLDLKMPKMDGLEVLKWLQSHPEKSSLHVFVLSNFGAQSQLQEAYDLGANSFLIKPFNKSELDGLIQHWPNAWRLSTNPAPPDMPSASV